MSTMQTKMRMMTTVAIRQTKNSKNQMRRTQVKESRMVRLQEKILTRINLTEMVTKKMKEILMAVTMAAIITPKKMMMITKEMDKIKVTTINLKIVKMMKK